MKALFILTMVTAFIYISMQIFNFNIATAQSNITGPPLIMEDELGSQFAPVKDTEIYNDSNVGFTIEYPSNWTIGDDDSGRNTVVSFDSPDGNVNVNIRVFPQTSHESLKEFGNTFKSGDDYTLLAYYRNSTTLLDGKPAFRAIYLTTSNPSVFEDALGYSSSTSKAMFIATLVPEKKSYFAFVYFAEPSTFQSYIPLIDKMIESFHIGSKGPVIQEED